MNADREAQAMDSDDSRPSRYGRTRRRLPERVIRLRWLRDAASDSRAPSAEPSSTAWRSRSGQRNRYVELRVVPIRDAQRLADEFFGRRYETGHHSDGPF